MGYLPPGGTDRQFRQTLAILLGCLLGVVPILLGVVPDLG
jgi:hypothetical protein